MCPTSVFFACSPVFLFQLVQPMTDVPVTAWWLAAIVAFASATLPGLAISALVNALLYGTPLQSGYGGISAIFHLSNLGPNIVSYPTWAVQTYSPFIFLAFVAPFLKHTSETFKRTAAHGELCHAPPAVVRVLHSIRSLDVSPVSPASHASAVRHGRPDSRHAAGTMGASPHDCVCRDGLNPCSELCPYGRARRCICDEARQADELRRHSSVRHAAFSRACGIPVSAAKRKSQVAVFYGVYFYRAP